MKHAPLTARLSALACLLLATLTVWSLTACNGKHKRSYDDDDDEEEDEEEVVNTSPLHIDDELLNSFDPNVPFEQTGHSQPFRIKPREDMTVSADAGAFERNVQIRVTDVPAEKMNELDGMLEDSGTTMLFAYDLDAGLPSDSVIPGKYTVSIDLDKHGIPEELYPYFMMYRVAGDGSLQPLNVRIKGHTASYMASQNSITLAAIAISAIKIGVGVGIGIFIYAHYPAILQTARHFADMGIWPPNWWESNDAVYEYVKDDFGNFYVCYRYSMTENGDKVREYVKKKKELKDLIDAMREEGYERYDRQHPQSFRGWLDSKEKEEERRIGREMESLRLMANSERVQKLVNDPVLQTPQSVKDIITATKLANRYCRSVQHMKPLSYEYVTWLTPPLEAWNEEACRFQVPLYDPCIIVNYSNVIQSGKYKKDTYYKNLTTISHETMHLYQMEYVVCSAFKDNCYLEATGALIEPHFIDWLINTVKLSGLPVTDAFSTDAAFHMGYSNREVKEMLSTPLGKKCPTYKTVKRTEHERGYMMADMLQYLWDHQPNPNDTMNFAKMMNRYAVNKGMLKSMQDIFGIESDQAFTKYYEGFCEKFISDIEQRQYEYRTGAYDDNLVMPNVKHDPEHCVMRVKNLGEKCSTTGQPFMVNTFRILPTATVSNRQSRIKPYHLFAVPSEKVLPREIKFTFFNTHSFSEDPMYYVPDYSSLGMCIAAVMTRPQSRNLTMGDDYYFDIVAFYQPTAMPSICGPSLDKRGLLVKPKCTPSTELKEKGYVTGLQIVMENNKTGRMQSFVVKVKDWKDEFVAPYDKLGISDTTDIDVSLRSRWYFDTPQGQRYYSPATDIVNYRRQSDNVQQTIEQDSTQVVTGNEIEGDDDQGTQNAPLYGPESIDENAYVSVELISYTSNNESFNMSLDNYNKPGERFKAHVVIGGGKFIIEVPACRVTRSEEHNYVRFTNTYDTPAFTVTGDYTTDGTNSNRGKAKLDLNSIQITPSSLYFKCEESKAGTSYTLTKDIHITPRRVTPNDLYKVSDFFYEWKGNRISDIHVNIPAHASGKYVSTYPDGREWEYNMDRCLTVLLQLTNNQE